MITEAQHSVTRCLIEQKLQTAKEHSDYATALRIQAERMLPELFPLGCTVREPNTGTLSIVVGHKDDSLAICNVGNANAGWTHWRNVNLRTP